MHSHLDFSYLCTNLSVTGLSLRGYEMKITMMKGHGVEVSILDLQSKDLGWFMSFPPIFHTLFQVYLTFKYLFIHWYKNQHENQCLAYLKQSTLILVRQFVGLCSLCFFQEKLVPEPISAKIHSVVFNLLSHSQLTIREHAAKTLATYITCSSILVGFYHMNYIWW